MRNAEQSKIEAWNRAHKVGCPVTYLDDRGQPFHTRTRSEAYVLSGHIAVVFIDDWSGCVALSRVEARQVANAE